jgi:signal transduction histidine kinase
MAAIALYRAIKRPATSLAVKNGYAMDQRTEIETLLHDLGQPLLAIRLNAELLMHSLGESGSDPIKKKIQAILQASQESMDIAAQIGALDNNK